LNSTPTEQNTYAGVPRSLIDWFPTIDLEKCDYQHYHHECVTACPRSIYEITPTDSVIVARPYECTVGDISCSFACPFDAISFPSRADLKVMLTKARENLG